MLSLYKCYECFTKEQESTHLTETIETFNDRKILFGTPSDNNNELEPNSIYIQFQHKGVSIPWYMLIYISS